MPSQSTSHERATPLQDAVQPDPARSAQQAGLRYISDQSRGIQRKFVDDAFIYLGVDGQPITNQRVLQRIEHLAIPPAWTDVWISPQANGHLQATGRDAKGRKQYRYHARWREVRDATKYNRMLLFGQTLPKIRERVDQDLRAPGLPREKVLATVVRLLETTFIRVGNPQYARENGSFGLTTLRDRHVDIEGATIQFRFRGKSGKSHNVELNDKRLARIVKRCQEIPGYELFQYIDADGQRHTIDSADVNSYLREISGHDFTAKDFRTWAGTLLTALALQEAGPFSSEAEAKKKVSQAIQTAASQLGNTPAICRKCYVHPLILESYLAGSLLTKLTQTCELSSSKNNYTLCQEEQAVLKILMTHVCTSPP